MGKKNQNFNKIASSISDIQKKVFEVESRIEIMGNSEVIIEGCSGIIEYDDYIIRVAVKDREIKFIGNNLLLKCLTNENIIISGDINNIEFIQ